MILDEKPWFLTTVMNACLKASKLSTQTSCKNTCQGDCGCSKRNHLRSSMACSSWPLHTQSEHGLWNVHVSTVKTARRWVFWCISHATPTVSKKLWLHRQEQGNQDQIANRLHLNKLRRKILENPTMILDGVLNKARALEAGATKANKMEIETVQKALAMRRNKPTRDQPNWRGQNDQHNEVNQPKATHGPKKFLLLWRPVPPMAINMSCHF